LLYSTVDLLAACRLENTGELVGFLVVEELYTVRCYR
jgi:hypothetical protein